MEAKVDDADDTGLELKNPYSNVGLMNAMLLLQVVQEHWLGSFFLNILGYALIIVPAALLIRRWKKDPQIRAGMAII